MKWHWGIGIVVAIISFMAFIMSLVIRMSTDTSYNHDLVTEDYYAKEMLYQNDIDAETNSNAEIGIKSYQSEKGWVIEFPRTWKVTAIKGKIEFYRPSNKNLDFSIPLDLKNKHKMEISNSKLIEGRWNIRLEFNYAGKNYLKKESVFF